MKTIAIIAQKGGSGKSMIAVNLAAIAQKQNIYAAVIDVDPQGSAYDWNQGRIENSSKSPKLDFIEAKENELVQVKKMCEDKGVKFLIIDTAPHSNKDAAEAAKIANFILMPCRPSRFDLKALVTTAQIARLTNTAAGVVINQAPPVGNRAERAKTIIEENLRIKVLPCVLCRRTAYDDALTSCLAVHEYEPKGKAAEEMAALFACIKQGLKL